MSTTPKSEKYQRNSVTIITDASWCPETKMAGYGTWIASDRGKSPGQGSFRDPVVNSEIAEMMAIVNSLVLAIDKGLVAAGDYVLIQSDCEGAIRQLQKKIEEPVLQSQPNAVRLSFQSIVFNKELKIQFRHVKGHSKRNEARYAANRRCDERAKTQMRKARNIFLERQAAEESAKAFKGAGASAEEVARALKELGEYAQRFHMEVPIPNFNPAMEMPHPAYRTPDGRPKEYDPNMSFKDWGEIHDLMHKELVIKMREEEKKTLVVKITEMAQNLPKQGK